MSGKRIVLVGAGSAQFGLGTVADILMSKVLSGGTIVLHDINPNHWRWFTKLVKWLLMR